MTAAVDALPANPLAEADLVALNNSDQFDGVAPYGGPASGDRVYAVMAITEDRVYALGFDDDADAWEQIAAFDRETENVTGELDRAVAEWVEATYGDADSHAWTGVGADE